MHISLLQENLQQISSSLQKVVPSQPQLPILTSILCKADDTTNTITFAATDLYLGIETKVPGEIHEPGVAAIPAKLFIDTVSSLKPGTLTLKTKDHEATLTNAQSTAKMQCHASDDYPEFPEKNGVDYSFSLEQLEQIEAKIAFAAATDQARPVLTCLYFQFSEEKAEVVATDGFRLAVTRMPHSLTTPPAPFLFPVKAFVEVLRIARQSKQKEVVLKLSEELKQIFCTIGQTTVFVRLAEGDFPPYRKIMPESFLTEAVLEREALMHQLKQALIFAREVSNVISMKFAQNEVTIEAQASTLGNYVGTLEPLSHSGDAMTIAFNARYVLDFLNNTKAESIAISLNDPLKPVLFAEADGDESSYVVMPFRKHE